MATISFDGLDEYMAQLEMLGKRSDAVIKPAVYDGADIVVDAVKKSLRRTVSENATGDLEESIGLSRMEEENGFVHTKLGFDGYDRSRHPNVVKARALEYGTSKQKKTPFIRPAVNAVTDEVIETMRKKVDMQIKNLMEVGE